MQKPVRWPDGLVTLNRFRLHAWAQRSIFKICRSISEALFERDRRDMFLDKRIVMLGLAQDGRQDLELMMMSLVANDFTVQVKMLGLHQNEGQKTALAKAHMIDQELTKFTNGNEVQKNRFKLLQRTFTSDGEGAEQLCPRLAKEKGILPNHKVTLRCGLHGAQKSLENALRSDDHIDQVLTEFVTKLSGKDNRGEHGAFGRALKNSARLTNIFQQNLIDAITELAADADHAVDIIRTQPRRSCTGESHVVQRFDTILRVLRHFVWYSGACVRFLCVVAAGHPASAAWAQHLLAFLFEGPQQKPTNAILLALVADFTQTASRFIHTAENKRYSIVQTVVAIQEMKTELDFLFAVEEPNGAPRKPFCFNDSHKHG